MPETQPRLTGAEVLKNRQIFSSIPPTSYPLFSGKLTSLGRCRGPHDIKCDILQRIPQVDSSLALNVTLIQLISKIRPLPRRQSFQK